MATKEVQPNSIIEALYVPFFRYPDDLTDNFDEMPLVDASAISGVIGDHLNNSLEWMAAPLYELRRRRLLDGIAARKNEKPSITVGPVDETEGQGEEREKITPSEFALRIFDEEQSRYQPYRKSCFDAARSLEDRHILPEIDRADLIRTGIKYGFAFEMFHFYLGVGIKLAPTAFAPFFWSWVNPKAHTSITTCAAGMLSEDLNKDAPAAVSLPPLFDQKRIAFESLAFQHACSTKAKRLDCFVHLAKNLPDGLEQRALFEIRHAEIEHILKRLPTSNDEMARAFYPLPYFLEVPLLVWERASRAMRLLSGLGAFGNILRIMALLGIAALRSNSRRELRPPSDLANKFANRGSSLGDWSKWLDWLYSNRAELGSIQPWISSMHGCRSLAIDIINNRNHEVVHSGGPVTQEAVEKLEAQLSAFFEVFGKSIRRCAPNTYFYYLLNHQSLRKRSGGKGLRFRGLDLVCPHECFREATFELPQSKAQAIFDEEIVVLFGKPEEVFSLNDYFRFMEVKPGLHDILVFEEAKDADQGLFTGVASGIKQKLGIDEAALRPFTPIVPPAARGSA